MDNLVEASPIIERKGMGRIKLILCGQEPVMEMGSSAKMADLEALSPGIVERYGPNSWMQTIARAAGIVDKRGEVDVIIPSGRRRGEVVPGQELVEPTEAEMMIDTAEKVYGKGAPQTDKRYLQSEVWLETEARNTIYNMINSANLIDENEKGNNLEAIKNTTYIIGTHYQRLRLKLLASYFGLDPTHVLSAEEVMLAQAKTDYKESLGLSDEATDKSDGAFVKSRSTINWLKTRVENGKVDYKGEKISYYQRKRERAKMARARLIERIINEREAKNKETGLEIDESIPWNSRASSRAKERAELERRLFIFEGKDIDARMREERRWVRGLMEVPEKYFIPLAKYIKNDQRILYFLGKFEKTILAKVGLENFEGMPMIEVRVKLEQAEWAWQPVAAEWENEEYPVEVKDKLRQMGLSQEEADDLSNAKVPTLD